ncbi:MAG: hypothetical protein A2V66_17550 [Ignavibacteria bacterium RBG_13_36_8]|nr:MAG: hypothetical protein A2V66_17550 [Ignavibacteria bacterium RBG_13_36_8]
MEILRKRTMIILSGIILILCISVSIIEANSKVFRKIIDERIYDNRNHYLTCDKLPSLTDTERVYQEHIDVIRQILEINPGYIGAEIQSPCSGKGNILFWYGSHKDRLVIEKVIGSETFYGIPYNLQNR